VKKMTESLKMQNTLIDDQELATADLGGFLFFHTF